MTITLFNFNFFFLQFHESFWLGLFKTQVPIETFFIISGFLTYVKIEGHLKSGKPLQFWYMLTYRLTRYNYSKIYHSIVRLIQIYCYKYLYLNVNDFTPISYQNNNRFKNYCGILF